MSGWSKIALGTIGAPAVPALIVALRDKDEGVRQSVAEALVRFMCHRNQFKAGKDFEDNVERLFKRRFIDSNLKDAFLEIWEKRNDYHHLNLSIEKDGLELERMSESRLKNLNLIENEIFGFNNSKGAIIPKYPKYWDIKDGTTSAYLKIES